MPSASTGTVVGKIGTVVRFPTYPRLGPGLRQSTLLFGALGPTRGGAPPMSYSLWLQELECVNSVATNRTRADPLAHVRQRHARARVPGDASVSTASVMSVATSRRPSGLKRARPPKPRGNGCLGPVLHVVGAPKAILNERRPISRGAAPPKRPLSRNISIVGVGHQLLTLPPVMNHVEPATRSRPQTPTVYLVLPDPDSEGLPNQDTRPKTAAGRVSSQQSVSGADADCGSWQTFQSRSSLRRPSTSPRHKARPRV